MITAKMTYHAAYERADRLAFIAEHIEIGTIQYKFRDNRKNDNTFVCFTSTGIMIVMDEMGTIITAFTPNVSRVIAIFRAHGWCHVPSTLIKSVEKNYTFAKKMGFA